MVEQNCKILIVFLLLLNCTIESRYWSGEGGMVQEIEIPENGWNWWSLVLLGRPKKYKHEKFEKIWNWQHSPSQEEK